MLNESIDAGKHARRLDSQVKINSSALNALLYAGQYERFLANLPQTDDSAFVVFYRGLCRYYLRESGSAARDLGRAYELEPTLYTQIGKALSYAILNERLKGLELLKDTERRIEERRVSDGEGLYKVAQVYAVLDDKPLALRALRRSIERGFFCYPYFKKDPLLENIRGEAEYGVLMEIARHRYEEFKRNFF